MADFLPEDYKVPSESHYMKFQAGPNRFRILGSYADDTAIMGMEYWKSTPEGGRTPVRVPLKVDIPISELEENDRGELENPKHFWALPVYNYAEGAVQILEITQKSIMNAIRDLSRNKKWGDPHEYDITVTKTGEKFETKYTVFPDPKEELPAEIQEKVKATKINIAALFSGDDPFRTDVPDKVDEEEVAEGIEKMRQAAAATKK